MAEVCGLVVMVVMSRSGWSGAAGTDGMVEVFGGLRSSCGVGSLLVLSHF